MLGIWTGFISGHPLLLALLESFYICKERHYTSYECKAHRRWARPCLPTVKLQCCLMEWTTVRIEDSYPTRMRWVPNKVLSVTWRAPYQTLIQFPVAQSQRRGLCVQETWRQSGALTMGWWNRNVGPRTSQRLNRVIAKSEQFHMGSNSSTQISFPGVPSELTALPHSLRTASVHQMHGVLPPWCLEEATRLWHCTLTFRTLKE